jgi:hypothetical protein
MLRIIKSLVARNSKGISRGNGRRRILRKAWVLATRRTLLSLSEVWLSQSHN